MEFVGKITDVTEGTVRTGKNKGNRFLKVTVYGRGEDYKKSMDLMFYCWQTDLMKGFIIGDAVAVTYEKRGNFPTMGDIKKIDPSKVAGSQAKLTSAPSEIKTADDVKEPNLLSYAIDEVRHTTGMSKEEVVKLLTGEPTAMSNIINTLMIDEGKRRRKEAY